MTVMPTLTALLDKPAVAHREVEFSSLRDRREIFTFAKGFAQPGGFLQ
jgi:hypothetical protein